MMKLPEKKVVWTAYKRSKSPEDWEAYVRRRNMAKETVKQARSKSWEDFGKEIEENDQENILFWTTVECMRRKKGKQIRNIKVNQNHLVTADILEVWRKHYEGKFSLEEYRGDRSHRPRIVYM